MLLPSVRDLRLGDAGGVDALADDRDGLVELLAARRLPLSICGARMICVPPWRSSASLGVHEPLARYTPSAMMPNSTTMMTPSQVSERQACRTGVDLSATVDSAF